MQDLVFVAESSPFQQLKHEATNSIWVESAAISMLVHVFLEILLAVFENKDELCFCVNYVVQSHNVDMLKFLHERDFANGSRWCSFLGIKVDLLQSHNLIRCARSTLYTECDDKRFLQVKWIKVTLYTVA